MSSVSFNSMGKLSFLNNKTQSLRHDAYALYLVSKDTRTPLLPKILAIAIVAYALSPIDLIPDFIPILGWIDDLLIVGFGIGIIKSLIPQNVWEEAKINARPVEKKINLFFKFLGWGMALFWVLVLLLLILIVWLVIRFIKHLIG